MKKLLAMLLALAMVLSLAACGGNTAKETETATPAETAGAVDVASGDVLNEATAMETAAESVTVAVDDDSFTIGPWGSAGAVRDWTETILWAHLCYRPFTGASLEAGELEMVAAKSVTKVDDTTYDIEINDNIVDNLGNKITAADVVYSYDKLAELGYVSQISLYYDHAETTGDNTLRMYLKSAPDGAIEEVLCRCSIASQAWYEGASQDEIESNPATTGAYYVSGVETASSITMTAKDNYWKTEDLATVELQNAKEIIIRCITEASMRSIALENNEVDMAEVSLTEVSRFDGNDAYTVTSYMNWMSQYLIFNTSENSVCQDVNVRKAIAYAFDSLSMLMGTGTAEGIVSHDVAPNLGPDYVQAWDEEEYFERNLEKSAEYLAAAGYKPGELEIHLLVTAQAPQGPYVALQAMLEEAGIKLVIDGYDRAVRQTYQNDPTMWDIAEYSDSVADYTTGFWNNLFGEENYEHGTQGFTEDPKLQELLQAAIHDRSEENLDVFHDYVVENCYMVGLYTETKCIVTDGGLTDICLQKLNPVLNAMSFTSEYAPAGK